MKLREYLERENMTQVCFAKLIDFHVVYVRDVIAGRKNAGKRLIAAIVKQTKGLVTEKELKEKKVKK